LKIISFNLQLELSFAIKIFFKLYEKRAEKIFSLPDIFENILFAEIELRQNFTIAVDVFFAKIAHYGFTEKTGRAFA